MARTRTSYFPLGGGLDLSSPALSVQPGMALALTNFEPWYNGGYRRVFGYERYDGRPKPSEQAFLGFDVSDASSLSLGDTVTGDTSGATGIVRGIWIDDGSYGTDAIGVTKVTGTFQLNEACNTAAFTIDRAPVTRYAPTLELEDTWLLASQDDYRDDILVVPGSGEVNGIWQRGANVYAIRNNAGATAGILHLSSASGWTTTGITMADYIYFDAGGGGTQQALPVEGDTLTGVTSGASGTVHRVVLHGGSTANDDAFGYFVLTGVTGGPFQNNEALQVSAVTKATADGANATFSFAIGGHYRFHNHNFYGAATTFRTYGVSGVGPAFEIDENNVVSPILLANSPLTGQPADNEPFLIEEHNNHLFLAYPGGSLVQTVQGEPLTINGFLGAAEFGIGDEITGLNSVAGQVLVVTSEKETRGLFGANITDWQMKLIGETVGGKLYTARKLDSVYALDDLGITSMTRADSFGDFVGSTVSQLIQALINLQRDKSTDATVVRAANQYRLYFNDGTALIMYIPSTGMSVDQRTQTRLSVNFGALSYPKTVYKIWNTEDETGKERTYFASDDGFVYEDQIGHNFDGTAIRSWCRTVFNQIKSPSYRKRFRRAVLELESQKPLDLKVISDLTYGSTGNASGNVDIEIEAGGGLWDTDNWDEFFWDGQTVSTATVGLTGTGENIGLLIYNETATARPFILQGITLHYDLRRLQR